MTDIYKLENFGVSAIFIDKLEIPPKGGFIYAALGEDQKDEYLTVNGARATLDTTQEWAYRPDLTRFDRPAVDDTPTGGADFYGNKITNARYAQAIKVLDYILKAEDSGSTIFLTKGSAIKVTIAADLPVGFKCKVVQYGAGASTIEAALDATASKLSTKTLVLAGQYGAAEIEVVANSDGGHAVAVVSGDLTTA